MILGVGRRLQNGRYTNFSDTTHRADFGLDGWRLHDLRHSFLTVAAQQGVHPSVMQKLAGHSTSRLTMDVYTHANLEDKRRAMDSMQEAFTKNEDTKDPKSTKVA